MLPSACAVVVDDGGRVLPGRRADTGNSSLPAGAIDPGEQPADAAVLEVYEETGVHIAVERLAGVALREVAYPHGDVCEFLTVWFRCRAIAGRAVVKTRSPWLLAGTARKSYPTSTRSTGSASALLLMATRRHRSRYLDECTTGSQLEPDPKLVRCGGLDVISGLDAGSQAESTPAGIRRCQPLVSGTCRRSGARRAVLSADRRPG
jgi:8-oxo-dGTP pyrophosphatase MutT (NUDIX family)